MSAFGIDILHFLLDENGPNKVCENLGLCDQCHLDLPPALAPRRSEIEAKARTIGLMLGVREAIAAGVTQRAVAEELPRSDEDNDRFSAVQLSYRGSVWRGRDCDDLASEIHPGLNDDRSGDVDNNCNGISGHDDTTGRAWEDEVCDEASSRHSVVVFGDSASAGFHIPAEVHSCAM